MSKLDEARQPSKLQLGQEIAHIGGRSDYITKIKISRVTEKFAYYSWPTRGQEYALRREYVDPSELTESPKSTDWARNRFEIWTPEHQKKYDRHRLERVYYSKVTGKAEKISTATMKAMIELVENDPHTGDPQ